MHIQEHVSLKDHHTFHLDVTARYKGSIVSSENLKEIFTDQSFAAVEKLILGGGSNVLFAKDYEGMVLLMAIKGIDIIKEDKEYVWVSFGAGENWHECVLWSIQHGYGGIENLSLIPGTVGAAPMQNIGAYGVEIKEVFDSLKAYEIATGNFVKFEHKDCEFGYRFSAFKGKCKNQYIITNVVLKLSKKPSFNVSYGNLQDTLDKMGVEELTLKSVSDAVISIRQSKLPDPNTIGNAGSFFKNPVIESSLYNELKAKYSDIPGYRVNEAETKVPAAWLIDQCGWKGTRRGDIGVHNMQALVLVNRGDGKGSDLIQLAKDIQASVNETFGIALEPEVNIIA